MVPGSITVEVVQLLGPVFFVAVPSAQFGSEVAKRLECGD